MNEHWLRTALSLTALAFAAVASGCEATSPAPPAAQPGPAALPAVAPPAPPATGAATAPASSPPSAAAPTSDSRGTEVLLCDGQTKVTVPEGTPGTAVASA
ncbi:MAG: hypothetical protein FWD17_08185, partial [Polyangiaceae bacterium]|nr:hypothetical protein [Polyangiaceae bacterium]